MIAEICKQTQNEGNIFLLDCNLTAAYVWLEVFMPLLLQREGMP